MKKILPAFLFLIALLCGNWLYAQVPTVTSFSPMSGPVGTPVTINGTNFSGYNVVFFGATMAPVYSATATQLVVLVPAGATYQPISVLNAATGLYGYSARPFTCTFQSTNNITTADILPKIDFNTGVTSTSVTISDIDGDGKPDLVIGNASSNTVSILLNTTTSGNVSASSFAVKVDITTNGQPYSISCTDVDGDGKPDLITANRQNNTVSVFRNISSAGTISFSGAVTFHTGNGPFAVVLGDLDQDGKPDLAVANFGDNTVSVLRNTSFPGTVNFAAKVDFATGLKPVSVVLSDLDGDGRLDLATADFGANTVSVLRNTTSGSVIAFAAKSAFATGLQPSFLITGDIDVDGKPDLIVANYGPGVNTISVLRNTSSAGAVSLAGKVDFATGSEPTSLSIGDMDGDGKPDVIITNFNAKTASILRNTSTPGSITTASLAAKVDFGTGNAPSSVSVGDINGDGITDMVTSSSFDSKVSVLQHYSPNLPIIFPESTASVSLGSFVNTDLMDQEWQQDIPAGYSLAGDNGTTINASGTGGTNAGRFVYFASEGTASPFTSVNGNLTFSAKGSGTIEVQILTAYNMAIAVRQTFTLTSSYQDFTWAISGLYPKLEYVIAVVFNGGNSSAQASGQFKKNFCLNLQQCGLGGNFTRYRADLTSLVGNSETGWFGRSYSDTLVHKKYLQHSAYARMKFHTDATHMVVEYVRNFFDKIVCNIFPTYAYQINVDWDAGGNIVGGYNVINNGTPVTPGKTYTISGLLTHSPSLVWFQNGVAMGAPVILANVGTTGAPLYQVTAPANADHMGLLIIRTSDTSDYADPVNDTFASSADCMVEEGAIGSVSQTGTVPNTFSPFAGFTSSYVSGFTVYINGALYKYYQLEGNDTPIDLQYLIDDLPPGTKDIEIVAPGQGVGTDPLTERAGTFLRAVYFATPSTIVLPSNTVAPGSICYIHDSILSGFNISSDAQNNVWMMKTRRDPAYGFTGDVFSEGYAGRILHTNTQTPALLDNFAQKLASFGVDKYWFQIGVNDCGFNVPLPLFYNEYKTLIEKLKVYRPNAKFYIQSIGPVAYEGPNGETLADNGVMGTGPTAHDFRDVQRAIATSHSYCEYVEFENLFPATPDNLPDGIHPNDSGNLLYTNGIRDKSTLLGTTLPSAALAFYSGSTARPDLKQFIQGVSGISIITATGGAAPYTFSLLSGPMPAGLTLNSDGTITGTSTQNGTFPLHVQVTDANSASINQTFSLIVNASPSVVVAPIHLVDAVQGVSYSRIIKGALGYGKYTLMQTGSLPPGMTYNTSTGEFSGTPTTVGTYNFTITAVDHWGFTGHTDYTFHVGTTAPAAPTDQFYQTFDISTGNVMVTAHLNDLYSQDVLTYIGAFVTQGGVERLLGVGLLTVPSAHLSGSATNFGTIDPTYGPATSVRIVTVGILPSPCVVDGVNISYDPTDTTPLLFNATQGTTFSQSLLGTLIYGQYTLTTGGSIPAGMSFNTTTGVLSGTPTSSGSSSFSVTATDAHGFSVTTSYTVVVVPVSAFAYGIYENSLENGWIDYSSSATVDYAGTSVVETGSNSMTVNYTSAYAYVNLVSPGGAPVTSSGFTSLNFSVYGGTGTNGKTIIVYLNSDYTHVFTVTLTEGAWVHVAIPMSSFGSPATLNQIVIQEASGSAGTVYIDNMGFN